MKTAVIYARYSSDSQSEQSIEGQLRVCQEFARSKDILILDTYIDRAMTGTNDNRPDFQRMIKDSRRREWDYVLVYKLDRFSRNKFEMATHKKTLKDNGTRVISAMENIPETPEGIILESMLEGYAEYYSAELSQKVRRGMIETRRKGNFTGGYLIYGYKIVDRKIVIDEERAEVVRFIFEQFALGVYVKDIIATLTAKGVYNRGKPFARNTVYNILKNEKYSGIYRHDGEVFENMYPQIVPTETFERVREKVSQNKYGKRSTEVRYLLRNKLKCGYCGQPISAECGTGGNGEVKRYYKCLGRKRGNNCKKSMIQKETLENFVIESIMQALSAPSTIKNMVREIMAAQEQVLNDNSCVNALTRQKKHIQKTIDNIMTAIEQGVITNTATRRMRELELQLEDLDRQILIERSKTSVLLSKEEIREYYEQALSLEPQMLINYLIKEILLFDDRIEIFFNSPLRISPDDDSRDFIIYSNIGYMPIHKQHRELPVMRRIEIIMRV